MLTLERLAAEGDQALAVLCGGPGGEREVSLLSGDAVHQALTRAGVPHRKVTVPESDAAAFLEELDCRAAVMMLHGEFGEGGEAQEILERRGIGYSGSSAASCRLAMDKAESKTVFAAINVPTPRWALGSTEEETLRATARAGLRYPLFVKPNYGGSSVGASRVERPEDFPGAVRAALATDRMALVEEMVVGRELTVGWYEGRVLPVVEMAAAAEFYDYEAKYLSDDTRYTCPAELAESVLAEVESIAVRVVERLGARDLARVDVMLGPDGPMALELNASPGFTGHSLFPMAAAAAGYSLESVCVRLAALAAGRAGNIEADDD